MANTYQEIYTSMYHKMGEKVTSTVFNKDTNILESANIIQDDVCKGSVTDILTDRIITCKNLKFMRERTFQEVVPQVTLGAAIAVTDTEITLDTTNFASSGRIVVNQEVITYTGKTATQLTGVSGVSRRHLAGDKVRQVYSLPADYFRISGVYHNNKKIFTLDERDYTSRTRYVQLVQQSGSPIEYLDVVGINGDDDIVEVIYYKSATDMTIDSSETNLPGKYGIRVISNIMAGLELMDTEEVEKGKVLLQKGYSYLRQLYREQEEVYKEFRSKIKTSPLYFHE